MTVRLSFAAFGQVLVGAFVLFSGLSLPLGLALAADADGDSSRAAAELNRETAASFTAQRDSAADMSNRAESKRDEAITKLKKILPGIKGPRRAELLFRLAEKYWSKSRYQHLLAMKMWDQALEDWNAAGGKGDQPKVTAFPQHEQAELYKRESLKLYKKILKLFPRYARNDEVYYNLGSSLYDAGDKRRGIKMLWKLIKRYPKSRYVPDSWLQLGEHFFNSGANKLTQAFKAYSEAAKTKKPRIYSFALYKLGWCDYNLGEFERSLKRFKRVVEYASEQHAAGGSRAAALGERDRVQLTDEALADMVRVYSHLDAVDDAFTYYEAQVGKERAYDYLRRLGQLYHAEGKFETEIATFEKLNKQYPTTAWAPVNHAAIVDAYAQLGKRDRVRVEVNRLLDLYTPDGAWARANAGDEVALERASQTVEERLSALVTEKHREARQTKLAETYKLARDIYKRYLDAFPESENAYKFRFYYAEILFELKEFEAAATEHDRLAAMDGEFQKPSAYSAVLEWEKVASGQKESLGKTIKEKRGRRQKGALKKLEKLKTLKKGNTYAETPLTEYEQRLAAACDRFTDVAPQDPEVVKVKFKSAQLYYLHNQFEQAAKRFGEIIDRWPEDRLGRLAAGLIVESFNVRSDWSNLNLWARKFQGNKRLMADRSFRKKIGDFVEGASFNEIHFVFEQKEGKGEVADRYVAFSKEFPQSRYVLVALFNAVVNYDTAGAVERGIAEARRVIDDYRKFKGPKGSKKGKDGSESSEKLPVPAEIREKLMFLLGSFYERLAYFDEAASTYDTFAREFPKAKKRSDAVFNAALFREWLGQYDAAVAGYGLYLKDYPKQDDVAKVAWRVGAILEKAGDHKAAQAHYQAYGKRYAARDAERRLCASYKAMKAESVQGRDIRRYYAGLVRDYKGLTDEQKQAPCALVAVAEAAFWQLEDTNKSYQEISLNVSSSRLARNLGQKLDMLAQLLEEYTGVLGLGQGDYGIAALYQIGKMHQHLAEAIFASPCPQQLDDDQCGMYQAALQEKAFPLEEKAIDAYDKALAKAYELGLYNEWLTKTQDALVAYEPGRFPEIHDYDLIASEAISEVPELLETYGGAF